MAAAPDLEGLTARLVDLDRARGLPHRIGEREQVVLTGTPGVGVTGELDDLPAARRREPLGMELAQIVGVRLGVRGERTQDDGPVSVGVGQRGDGGTSATGLRATTGEAHDRGL